MGIRCNKKLIEQTNSKHNNFVKKADEAEKYYKNQNDIIRDRSPNNIGKVNTADNPLRNADNRIPFNWFGFLVNQKYHIYLLILLHLMLEMIE
ncbi:phage portal protein [Clostridioides difficile]|nr:phage portal protein [Clostridioides difficile]MBT2158763.1 phage portal protein [Clostridioides difficile]